jgi:hypothetical protein
MATNLPAHQRTKVDTLAMAYIRKEREGEHDLQTAVERHLLEFKVQRLRTMLAETM